MHTIGKIIIISMGITVPQLQGMLKENKRYIHASINFEDILQAPTLNAYDSRYQHLHRNYGPAIATMPISPRQSTPTPGRGQRSCFQNLRNDFCPCYDLESPLYNEKTWDKNDSSCCFIAKACCLATTCLFGNCPKYLSSYIKMVPNTPTNKKT